MFGGALAYPSPVLSNATPHNFIKMINKKIEVYGIMWHKINNLPTFYSVQRSELHKKKKLKKEKKL